MSRIGEDIGQRILLLLKKKRITQKELATRLNMNEATLSRYIKNEREPKIEFLVKVAKELGTTIDYLAMGKPIETSYENFYQLAQMNSNNLTDEQKLKIMSLILKYSN